MIRLAAPWPYLDSHVDAFREWERQRMIERRNRIALASWERRRHAR